MLEEALSAQKAFVTWKPKQVRAPEVNVAQPRDRAA